MGTAEDRKFELTGIPGIIEGCPVSRIRALKSFSDVKKGELGGFVEHESNLAHGGDCWIYGESAVIGAARIVSSASVRHGALVAGESRVFGSAKIMATAKVYGRSRIGGSATISGNVLLNNAAVYRGNIC